MIFGRTISDKTIDCTKTSPDYNTFEETDRESKEKGLLVFVSENPFEEKKVKQITKQLKDITIHMNR